MPGSDIALANHRFLLNSLPGVAATSDRTAILATGLLGGSTGV